MAALSSGTTQGKISNLLEVRISLQKLSEWLHTNQHSMTPSAATNNVAILFSILRISSINNETRANHMGMLHTLLESAIADDPTGHTLFMRVKNAFTAVQDHLTLKPREHGYAAPEATQKSLLLAAARCARENGDYETATMLLQKVFSHQQQTTTTPTLNLVTAPPATSLAPISADETPVLVAPHPILQDESTSTAVVALEQSAAVQVVTAPPSVSEVTLRVDTPVDQEALKIFERKMTAWIDSSPEKRLALEALAQAYAHANNQGGRCSIRVARMHGIMLGLTYNEMKLFVEELVQQKALTRPTGSKSKGYQIHPLVHALYFKTLPTSNKPLNELLNDSSIIKPIALVVQRSLERQLAITPSSSPQTVLLRHLFSSAGDAILNAVSDSASAGGYRISKKALTERAKQIPGFSAFDLTSASNTALSMLQAYGILLPVDNTGTVFSITELGLYLHLDFSSLVSHPEDKKEPSPKTVEQDPCPPSRVVDVLSELSGKSIPVKALLDECTLTKLPLDEFINRCFALESFAQLKCEGSAFSSRTRELLMGARFWDQLAEVQSTIATKVLERVEEDTQKVSNHQNRVQEVEGILKNCDMGRDAYCVKKHPLTYALILDLMFSQNKFYTLKGRKGLIKFLWRGMDQQVGELPTLRSLTNGDLDSYLRVLVNGGNGPMEIKGTLSQQETAFGIVLGWNGEPAMAAAIRFMMQQSIQR
jgi:hypothetical protein